MRNVFSVARRDMQKLKSFAASRGIRFALKSALTAVSWRLYPPRRAFAKRLREEQIEDRAFDREFGVETSGDLSLASLGIGAREAASGNGIYRPIWRGLFNTAMQEIAIRHEDFTFVDFGSGKGKAVFLAAQFPFLKCVGVEFSQVLHEAAQRNIQTLEPNRQRASSLEAVCMNAIDYVLPPTPLVCFFFNPFADRIMRAVLARIGASLSRHPRPLVVVYANVRSVEEHQDVFRECAFLKLQKAHRNFLIYHTDCL